MLKIYHINHCVSIDGTEWRKVGDTGYCVSDEDLNEKISFENLSFEGACEYLSKHFINGLWIDNPLLCRKPIIRICPSSSWEPISYKKFKTLSYKLKDTEWTDVTLEWIMKHLSVDQCIQYLKERGIMACPVLKGE